MAAPRFFIPVAVERSMAGQALALPEPVAHHATRVVRLDVGDALTLFDGNGGEFQATLTRIDKRGAEVRIDRYQAIERESSLAITLAQAVIATDAMDYAIRKATELGATAIQPLIAARSAAMPSGERAQKRHAHWRQVAIAACEQCGRNRIPEMGDVRTFDEWIREWRGAGIMLAPDAQAALRSLQRPQGPIALLIGPEGGWQSGEVAAASKAHFSVVALGPRILRADTAGTAAIAAMQTLWGDFNPQ